MAKKRSRKNKKKKRIRFHRSFFLPFLITLTAAVAAGVLALAAHQWIMEPVKMKKPDIVRPDQGNRVQEADREAPEEEAAGSALDKTEKEAESASRYQEVLDDPAYMEENGIYAREPAEPGKVTMTFAGDILFDTNYAIMGTVGPSGDISKGVTLEVIERMQAADIMMLNNEFAYSYRGAPFEE